MIYQEKALIKECYQSEYNYLLKVKVNNDYYNLYYNEKIDVGRYVLLTGNINAYSEEVIPNGFDAKRYYLGNNIKGFLTDVKIVSTNDKHFTYFIEKIKINLTANLSDKPLNIINKIIFNNNNLDQEEIQTFKDLNVFHLINLSGMHIYLLLYLIRKINFKLNIDVKYQKIIEISAITVLYLFSGYKYIILRILIYNILKILKYVYNLKITDYNLMQISFLFLIIYKPYLMINQGIMLSFIIVNVVTLLIPLYENKSFFYRSTIISLFTTLVLLPFNQTINIISIIMMPILMIIAIYIIFPLAILTLIFNPFAIYLSFSYDFLFSFITFLNEYFNSIVISIGSLSIIAIILYYLLFYLLIVYQQIIKKVVVIIFLIIVISTPNIQRKLLLEQMYFLDVGQGDSFVYISSDKVIIIDAYKNVGNFLKSKGIKKIDYLILSHADSDHSLEAQSLIDNFRVDNIILSKYDNYNLKHNNIKLIKAPYNIKIGSLKLDFYGPLKAYNERNNNSLVFKMTTNYYSILFTGDILKEAEYDIANEFKEELKSDIIKVAHHGSKTSSTIEILKYINPKFAIISYANNNRYGFPHDETLINIKKYTSKIYHTSSDYTIIIYQDKIYKFKSLTMKRRRIIV